MLSRCFILRRSQCSSKTTFLKHSQQQLQLQQQSSLSTLLSTTPNGTFISTTTKQQQQQQKNHQNQQQQYRLYHATRKQEILPVIALGAVLFVGRYSWKALKRMDEEWEDYLWQLQQFERQRVKEAAAGGANMVLPTTVGVDLGSIYLKLSMLQTNNKPEIIPTAQGERYRFTGILLNNNDDNDDNQTMIFGQPALDKFFYQPLSNFQPTTENEDTNTTTNPVKESVILPYRELQKASHEEAAGLVQKVFVPAVAEAMERLSSSSSSTQQRVRTVLTLPPPFYNQHGETIFQNYHDESHYTITVPDPVAAIWGAQNLNIIPTPESKEDSASLKIMVIDIGGLETTISLVKQDKVIATTTLNDIGGENFTQQLVNRVFEETSAADVPSLSKDVMSLALVNQAVRMSALELINKTSTKVHIPYLFMGRKQHRETGQPHFESTISRTVMEQVIQDYWIKYVIPKLVESNALSNSLPPPTNASSLITSAVTKVLEDSEEIPSNIKHILIVGGGSRYKLFENACRDGIDAIMGPNHGKMVLPEPSLRAELPSLGAAALLPNFDYSYTEGLQRAG